MKAGDKVICKQNFNLNGRRYHCEKKYEVFVTSDNDVFIITDDFHEDGNLIKGMWFYCKKEDSNLDFYYYYKYFYTKQELRNMKLKKLKYE